jgi:hypothetical protein
MALYHTLQWYRHNHLNPDISKDAWTHEEDLKLVEAHLVIQVFVLEEFFFKRKKWINNLLQLNPKPRPSILNPKP